MAIITESTDAASDTSTAYTIAGGDVFRGTLDTTTSTDWVRSVVSDSKSYYWTLTGDGSGNSLSALRMFLFDDNGTQITSVSSGGLAYTPTTQGDLYLQVGNTLASSGSSGNYRLTLTEEIADNSSTTETLTAGETVAGLAEYRSDRDWYEVTLTAQDSYYWTLSGDGSGTAQTNFDLALFDANGTEVSDGGADLVYTPTAGGTYYVQTGDRFTNSGQDGTYLLNMTAEVVANDQTRASITAGQTVAGRAEYRSDRDWFEVTLATDQSYYWSLTGDGSNDAQTNFDLALFDATGTEVGSGEAGMAYTPTTAGTYYVQTGDRFTNSGQQGNYVLAMVAEIADNDQTGATLEDGEVITGRADYTSDRDWYAVTLSSDNSYYWTMTGDGSSDAVQNFYLTLFDANGTQITDGRADMDFTPVTDGTYYVQTGRNFTSSGQDGVYTLGMTAELTANADTQGTIAAGQTQNSRSEYNTDRDWYATSLETGYSYFWTLAGDGSEDALERFNLTLFDANGTQRDAGSDLMDFTPTDAGIYYVQTGTGQTFVNNYAGNYALDMVRETSDGFGTLARIGVNEAVNDTLEYRLDKDMYRTTLEAGRTYEISMTGDGGVQNLDRAGLGVYSANGTELQVQRGADNDLALEFTATTTGTYFILAGEMGNFITAASHGLGSYELGVSKGTLSGTAGNDRLTSTDDAEILRGLDGTDTLIGNGGDDELFGGSTDADLRDVIFGGDGNDTIDGGYGNDELRGDAGNDLIAGGFGADTLIGGTGNDTLTGAALGDILFGGDGDDFVNGGFGFDRINGGTGADDFFHLGVINHGSDWVQDYTSAEGDVLVFGRADATRSQFQINEAFTPGAGDTDVADAFIIFRPTGQIVWALVDGTAQNAINLQIGGEVFDLMV